MSCHWLIWCRRVDHKHWYINNKQTTSLWFEWPVAVMNSAASRGCWQDFRPSVSGGWTLQVFGEISNLPVFVFSGHWTSVGSGWWWVMSSHTPLMIRVSLDLWFLSTVQVLLEVVMHSRTLTVAVNVRTHEVLRSALCLQEKMDLTF